MYFALPPSPPESTYIYIYIYYIGVKSTRNCAQQHSRLYPFINLYIACGKRFIIVLDLRTPHECLAKNLVVAEYTSNLALHAHLQFYGKNLT